MFTVDHSQRRTEAVGVLFPKRKIYFTVVVDRAVTGRCLLHLSDESLLSMHSSIFVNKQLKLLANLPIVYVN